jgi:pimeloyl-ACP methyl ester carboxylesterase
VYLVSGWSNPRGILLPAGPGEPDLRCWLGEQGAEVRDCWWNALAPGKDQNPGPFPRPFSDHGFVRDLAAELDRLPPERKVVLIGHSFGAHALLRVARRTSRPIDFLGLIDATGPAGLRTLARRDAVPANVRVVWNRWQDASPFPLDFRRTGRLRIQDPGRTCADQAEADAGRHGAHDRLHRSGRLQRELIAALSRVIQRDED